MNRTIIIGNVTRTPESKTVNDKTVCNFDVAVNERRNNENMAVFFRVAAWGNMGENCQKYLDKGSKVCVEGKISARAYAGQDGAPKASLELMASNVEFLSSKGQSEPNVPQSEPNATQAEYKEVNTEELPF